MPIDTRFLNTAKDKFSALKRSGVQIARSNPLQATSAAAAMLLAPALMSNDNRSYMQTAAFTTPLIGVGAYAASVMAPSAGRVTESFVGSNNAQRNYRQTIHATEITYTDIKNAQKAYEDQRIALAMFTSMKRRFYAGRRKGSGDLGREANALSQMVNDNLNTDTRIKYLSNSIHAEKLRTMSAADTSKYGASFLTSEDIAGGWAKQGTNPIPKIAPILTPDEIKRIVEGEIRVGNHKFIRGMSSRVNRMNNLIDPGGSRVPGRKNRVGSGYSEMSWNEAPGVHSKIIKERPDLYNSITRGIETGFLDEQKIKVRTTENGKILGFQYSTKGRRNKVSIPYVSPNGEIQTGKGDFGRTGVARNVFTGDKYMKSDVYAFDALSRSHSPQLVGEELKRANMFGLVDSSTDFATYIDPEYGQYVLHNGAQKLRRYQAIPSNLYGFREVDEVTGEIKYKGFKSLVANAKVEAIQDAASTHKLTKVGSEAGAYQGVLEERHLDELSLNPSREKQNSVWRAETKGVRLGKSPNSHNPNTWSVVRDRLDPFFQSNKLQEEGIVDHGVSVRTAAITPGETTLFGEMPDISGQAEEQIKYELSQMKNASKAEADAVRLRAYMEGFAASGRYDLHAMSILKSEHKMTHAGAKDAWQEVVRFLSDPKNMRVMQKAGRVGEGEFLASKDLYGSKVERYVRYDVHEETMPDWDSFIGTSIEERFGAQKGQQVILGRRNGNPVTAGGMENFIENTFDMGEDMTGILVRETKSTGTGTKWNIGSQKGLQHAFDQAGDSEIFRQGINTLRSAVGDNGAIPGEVNMFVSQVYNSNKSSELQDDLASIAGDTLRRVQENGNLDAVMSTWKKPLDDLGLVYRDDVGTLEWDVATTRGMKTEDRIAQQTQILDQMLADVGTRIRNHQIKGDAFMESYASYSDKGGKLGWTDYVNRYANPQTARVTDDMIWNSPKETKLAYYTTQQLVNRGQHGIAAELLDRLKYDGDPGMTKNLQDYFNGDKNAITRTLDLDEALDGRSLKNLGSAEERANTIFDPGFGAADENLLLKMPNGSTVPVLGHEAYGGKVNRYGTGQFSASDHEKELFNLINMHKEGATDQAILRQTEEYEGSLKKFLHGKDSLYRSGPVDPLAHTFRFGTRPSGLRYEDGSVNPFEIGLGRDSVAKIRDKQIREAIFNGEDVFMMGTREPVSHTPLYKVTIDDALNNSNIIGMDEGMRGLLMADADGDYIMAHFLRPKGAGADEARAAVFGEDSIQRHSVQFQQRMVGVGDETRKMVGSADGAYKPFTSRLSKQKIYSMEEALRKRSTAGSIGSGSNVYSLMLAALEENTAITNPQIKDDLNTFFFQAIKQGPISAAKLKGSQDMDLVRALGINSALRSSMQEGGKFDQFYSAMNELAGAADGEERTAFRNYLQENRDMLRAFHGGFDRAGVNQAVSAMTTPGELASRAETLGMAGDMFTYAQAASQTAEEARTATATAANASAMTLGMWNQAKAATEEVSRAARTSKLGLVIGAGLAAAAIAGIATTRLESPVSSFGRDSGGRYRPEENAPGRDQHPQDGEAGSRAPSRPARSIQQTPAHTRTAIVAPLGESRDLDVQLRAKDHQRAAHTAKMMSRMATDGNSTVTINYRDQMKPKSFRTKERMRDALEG
jgi:hypothetical protein